MLEVAYTKYKRSVFDILVVSYVYRLFSQIYIVTFPDINISDQTRSLQQRTSPAYIILVLTKYSTKYNRSQNSAHFLSLNVKYHGTELS